jgi:hypothetical protein
VCQTEEWYDNSEKCIILNNREVRRWVFLLFVDGY